MNERIRELAEIALEYAEKNQSADIPQHWFRLYNEKFAELLIREALDLCYNRGMNDELYAGQLKAAAYIEEHFGVK